MEMGNGNWEEENNEIGEEKERTRSKRDDGEADQSLLLSKHPDKRVFTFGNYAQG